jgi:HD-like signal output (HDOD) protein
MLERALQDLDAWVIFFSNEELPILRQTARRLEEARAGIDRVNGRDIAAIVLQDPLMTIRVLAYIQPFRGKHLQSDITTIGNAVMMLGVEPFFASIGAPPTIEANVEEVTLAALLHDLAEILLWCFAPRLAIEIRDRQRADKTLRSAAVQQEVLGIRLVDLQLALCGAWQLPPLLTTLMDDANAHLSRVQNVALAVNLARHSASGWDDAALPDDLAAIGKLLNASHESLLNRLDIPEEFLPLYRAAEAPAASDAASGVPRA